ncbi:MAG: FIG004453: protein YceG like [uncultured Nocardioidaceae bacterium]|uniref:Endolytic murein transglycosylase n=1 Tax=uncultured Nocardioidaceae bacterium TaxID=253824 RepID=A0A6J4MM24_9ACTN|nr:MAG: FIG004453: protein YceG like [uncultured Nocardioidaceae bacterium]
MTALPPPDSPHRAEEPRPPSIFDDDPEDLDGPVGAPGPAAPRTQLTRRGRRLTTFVAFLVVALVIGGAAALVAVGVDRVRGLFGTPAADYAGPGRGSVVFEVEQGDGASAIGRRLKAEGVVKSVDAFVEAAEEEPDSRGIQVGFYELQKQMPAADALTVLVNPANLVQSTVTVPEGLRVEDTLAALSKGTELPVRAFERVLEDPDAIGLPAYARGNPEGYLFPATYAFPPNTTPTEVLATMVDRWRQAAEDADLEASAERLGYSPGELMIVASLVEAEANRDEDRGKVARVVYNRLETDETGGLLQIDATVNYALGRDLGLQLNEEQLQVDSPYNTRRYPGLPPGPIESPGDKAIEAAAKPPRGPWLYYATVNLDTGETKFTADYDVFLQFRDELQAYCDTSDRC